MFLTSDFYIIGGKKQLGVVSGSDGMFILNDPILQSCNIDYCPNHIEVTTCDSETRQYMAGRPEVTLNLSIVAGGEFSQCSSIPGNLRMADDMTVRQLLATINRKIKTRV